MPILKSIVCELSLSTRGRRVLFLAVAAMVAVLSAWEAMRIATAATLSGSTDPITVERALALDPVNAEIEHRLGLLFFYSDSAPDVDGGLRHLRRATEIDPREALYWSDLAAACEALHDTSCADGAVARSLAASPATPRIYWSAANYDLRAGRQSEAFSQFRRLLELDPAYADAVFQTCFRMLASPESVAQAILPDNRNQHVAMAFVSLASGLGDDDAAYAEWQRLASVDYPDRSKTASEADGSLALTEVEPYLNHLIDRGRQRDSVAVWNDLERLGVIAPAASGQGKSAVHSDGVSGGPQLVFNGGFERSPLNGGFDWRFSPQPFVSVTTSDLSHSGSHSLRVEFSGDRNQEYEPVFEVAPVEPGWSYTLSAYVRSQAITSDTGPRLRVRDLTCPVNSCLDVSTTGVASTADWHEISTRFTAGPATRLVRVSIWRPRSRGYPSEISGSLWVDDVSIVPSPSPR